MKDLAIRIATEDERAAVFALRLEVFVDEQHVPPEIELDAEDAHALHILATDGELAVGCARVILGTQDAHIGRLAVKKNFRGRGIGAAICRFILADCRRRGVTSVWLNSQLHAVGFYEKLGFAPEREYFMEAGIEHVKMTATFGV